MENWKGTARLTWYRSGSLVGDELASFAVECTELPDDDRLTLEGIRRDVTLRLVCADVRERYGVPPSKVDIRLPDEEFPEVGLDRARWRLDAAGYCYGTGIMRVGSPPPGARLASLEITEGQVDAH